MKARVPLVVATLVGWLGILPALRAGVVEEWNAEFIAAIQSEAPPPALAGRNLAMLHLAIYEAAKVEGVDPESAVCAAGHQIAGRLYPARTASFDALFDRIRLEQKSQAFETKSLEQGRAAAAKVLADRENDGSTTTVPYIPSAAPGQWRRTAPGFRPPELPQWPGVRGFVIEKASQFRPAGPPTTDSVAYGKALDEVRTLGGKTSTVRTAEQSVIARFWADFSYTSTPPGHWNDITRQITSTLGMNVEETARVFAMLNLAMADAGIAAWDAKYYYNLWRPYTAIRRADEDGLESTSADPAWESFLPTPPHPEYVSGHSCFSGAAAEVLTRTLGNQLPLRFQVTSRDVPEAPREFTSFWDCAREIAMSRIYAGIHYRFSNEDGLRLGQRVADCVLTKYGAGEEPGVLPPK